MCYEGYKCVFVEVGIVINLDWIVEFDFECEGGY